MNDVTIELINDPFLGTVDQKRIKTPHDLITLVLH